MIVCVFQSFRLHLDNKEAYISLLNDRLTVFTARFAQREVKTGVVNSKMGVAAKNSRALLAQSVLCLRIQKFLWAPLLGTPMVIKLLWYVSFMHPAIFVVIVSLGPRPYSNCCTLFQARKTSKRSGSPGDVDEASH